MECIHCGETIAQCEIDGLYVNREWRHTATSSRFCGPWDGHITRTAEPPGTLRERYPTIPGPGFGRGMGCYSWVKEHAEPLLWYADLRREPADTTEYPSSL